MKFVRQILQKKGTTVWSIAPDDTVFDALKLMAEKEVGALLVIDGDKLAGIFSERDYARKVILKGRSSRSLPVRDIMTTDVLYIHPDLELEECMAIMTEKRLRHLPVMENDALTGIISIGDVVKAVIDEKEFLISQLENYIHGAV